MLPFVDEPLDKPENTDGLYSVCYYSGKARCAILRMKKGMYRYSIDTFAVLMSEALNEHISEIDFVTAVPTSLKRRMALGYAQAEKIGRILAMRKGKQYRNVIKVSNDKQEQKKLNSTERYYNALQSYSLCNEKYIKNKNILLVDDVVTTGSTVSAIAGKMKKAGAKSVYVVSFAKTRKML